MASTYSRLHKRRCAQTPSRHNLNTSWTNTSLTHTPTTRARLHDQSFSLKTNPFIEEPVCRLLEVRKREHFLPRHTTPTPPSPSPRCPFQMIHRKLNVMVVVRARLTIMMANKCIAWLLEETSRSQWTIHPVPLPLPPPPTIENKNVKIHFHLHLRDFMVGTVSCHYKE